MQTVDEAFQTLLAVAQTHPKVHGVRFAISPDNSTPRSLIEGYGFKEIGEQ